MEFKDIADIIHTGGQSVLFLIAGAVWVGAKRVNIAIETLQDILTELRDGRAEAKDTMRDIARKLDDVHGDIASLPLNLLRMKIT
jgi:hypothetical protein